MGHSLDHQSLLREAFDRQEANVRSYCRSFPAVFSRAKGATLFDVDGRPFIDFLSGAGALNYGHNNPAIKSRVLEYIAGDGVVTSLDLHTRAKHGFIEALSEVVLAPRGLDYRLAFPGPTGTNAIELALKLARRATGRHNVVAFTNGYHGMTLGALAASGTKSKRAGAGIALTGITRLPYDGYMGPGVDTSGLLERMLEDAGSGLDQPAAILVETLQAEGGLNAASSAWLQKLRAIADRHGIVLIVDDIQTGCGRTGTFFSFESLGITPDIVCLSKSISGMGMPMSLVLLRPELDVLSPGQHNGTFRGNNLAFVAGAAALELWRGPELERTIAATSSRILACLSEIVGRHPGRGIHIRGRGMLLGIGWTDPALAREVSEAAYERGLVIETAGATDEVLKLLPPLTIGDGELSQGLAILDEAIAAVLEKPDALAGVGREPLAHAAG